MELRHLRYFVAVAEELNFTRAARRLHIAQPPLSMQIRALEEELEVQLFERDKRRVFLTQAGRQFLDRARCILLDVDSAKGEARSAASGASGRLAVGYSASAMMSIVMLSALQRFRMEFPDVLLSLHETTSMDQLTALDERNLDIGVLRKPDVAVPDAVVVEEWHQSRLIAVIPRGHRLSGAPITLADLRDEPLITYPPDVGIGLQLKLHDLCANAGFRANIVHKARDASTMVGLVAVGVGIALLPDDARCINLHGAVFQPVKDAAAASSLWIAHRRSDLNPFTAQMLSILRAERGRTTEPPPIDCPMVLNPSALASAILQE